MPKFDALEAQSFSSPRPTQAPIGIWANGASVSTQPLIAFRNAQGTILSSINSDGTFAAPYSASSTVNPGVITGQAFYYYTGRVSAAGTASASGWTNSGDGVVSPWLVTQSGIVITKLGIELNSGNSGTAGSKLRLVIYSDSGVGYPGSVFLDAGQIDATQTTSQEATVSSVSVPPGLYWVGAVLQSAGATKPTTEVFAYPSIYIPIGTSKPTSAAAAPVGYAGTSLGTGALTASFTAVASASPSVYAPRMFVKIT